MCLQRLVVVALLTGCILTTSKTLVHNVTMAEERVTVLDGLGKSVGGCHVLYFAKEAEGLAQEIASLSEGDICLGSLSWGKFPDGYCALSCVLL